LPERRCREDLPPPSAPSLEAAAKRPDDYDQSFETEFAALIDKLDPPVVR
jgi:hypothetical protein